MRSFQTRTIYGHILSTGVQDRGVPVTVQKAGTGVYVITLPPGMRSVSWNASTDSGGGAVVDVDNMTGNGFTARTYLSSTGGANDWGFHFTIQVVA